MKKIFRILSNLALPFIILLTLQPKTSLAQWTTIGLSEAKWQVFAAAAGKKVVFAGGSKGANTASPTKADIYDMETQMVTPHTLSPGRSQPGMVAAGDKIFIAGGYKLPVGPFGFNSAQIDIYDAQSDEWSKEQLSVPRFSLAAGTAGNKVLFAGGVAILSGGTYEFYDVIDVYDLNTGDWDTLYLSEPRAEMAVVTVGNKVLFAGGTNNEHLSVDVVDVYDAATHSMLAPMKLSLSRDLPAATAVGKFALIAGGGHFGNAGNFEWSDVVDIWDSEMNKWSTASLSQPRAFMTAGTIGSRAFFAGGGEADLNIGAYTTSTTRVDIYDHASGWSTGEMPSSRSTCYGTVSCNQLFVPGGWYPEGPQIWSDVLVFTDSSFSCINSAGEALHDALLIAPNPVRQEIQLRNLEPEDYAGFEIFSQAGRSVIARQDWPAAGKIDVSTLAPGAYYLRVTWLNGKVVYRRFVKV